MKNILLIITSSIIFSCGPSLCDCVELDRNSTFVGSDFGGMKRSSSQVSIDVKFRDCSEKFDGMDSVRRRKSECN